ncbi:hypothetical protein Salat_2778600 [Sesamum alatum]|uniref:Uncharacterized protein n=1 Tax=Sesamum alatum TaxID=300844 RepID=A0AAE2C975_9LAMI|nr:hypothetical protein Salat_2778600 [Sesamum alatum]
MRFKSWPYFQERNPDTRFVTNDTNQGLTSNINVDPTTNWSSVPKGTSGSAKKRKRAEVTLEERLVEIVSNFCQDADNRIDTLTRVLETEFGNPVTRLLVCDAIPELGGLDENVQLVIVQRLHNNLKDMKLFFSLSPHKHGRLAKLMVEGRF